MLNFLKCVLWLLLAGAFLQVFSSFSVPKGHNGNKKNFTGMACPTIDISTETIIHPACGQSDGSITGITVTSTGTKKFYTWYDGENDVIGHSVDLKNIPAGTYTLEVTDNSGCSSSVFSPKIVVLNANAITIDDSEAVILDQSCNNDGAITGVTITGATKIDWQDTATGAIVSTSATSADLIGVNAGTYQLYAYNSTCQLTSKVFTVSHQLQVPTVVQYDIVEPSCAGEGSATIKLNVQPGQPPLAFYVVDAVGNEVARGVIPPGSANPVLFIRSLDGSDFKLFVVNNRNCSVQIGSFHVDPGIVTISHSKTIIVNDRCDQHLGTITPVIMGGTPPSKTVQSQYVWTDINTHQVVGTSNSLIKVGAGTYSFKITDPFHCVAIDTFTVINIAPALILPKAEGTTLCLPGMINITVSNANIDSSRTFKLYGSIEDSIPLLANSTGVFYLPIDHTTDFYLTRSNGTCESARTKVTEVVVADVKIPNAFTPNNDGINDYWNITGIEKFPGADISVFNRNGQLIFHSIDYSVPFKGTWNEANLPTGVYYYVIDVKQPVCFGKISGSLTIIR